MGYFGAGSSVIFRRVRWLCVSSGAFWGSGIGGNIQGAGFVVCTSYTVQKPQGGRRSAGAGCSVIGAGFVYPCQPVGQFGRVQVWFRVQRGHSDKCSKQLFEWLFGSVCQNFQPNPDRISTESQLSVEPNLDRISESLSLTFEPNPNRMFDSVRILFC